MGMLVTRTTRNMDADPLHYCGCLYDEEGGFYDYEEHGIEIDSDE